MSTQKTKQAESAFNTISKALFPKADYCERRRRVSLLAILLPVCLLAVAGIACLIWFVSRLPASH